MDRVLIFDLWGDLGHFKKPYTITSPLSFAFPPRTTVAGIIAAILGMQKTTYAYLFRKKDASIGIGLLNPVKKMRLSQNLIDTKTAKLFSRIKQRTQIRIEYVKDPRYRIYFSHRDPEIYQKLKGYLAQHECIYTIALGLSELLANFQFLGDFGIEKQEAKTPVEMHSIVPEKDSTVDFEEGKEYFSATIPLEMGSDRIVTQFGTVVYERNAQPMQVQTKSYFEISNGDRILFL